MLAFEMAFLTTSCPGSPRSIAIKADAVPILRDKGGSLLAIGITGVTGSFTEGDIVNILAPDGQILARGVATFDAHEVKAIAGKSSDELKPLYPSRKHLEVVHRDNLVLL